MDAALDAMDAPRTFHYVFAHRSLPMLAAKNAPLLQEVLKHDGRAFLRLHWKATCRSLGIEPQPWEAIGYGPGSDVMGRVGLSYAGETQIAGYNVAFVQLPLALQVREAHYVAILHGGTSTRYIAWERSLDGGARIAEWRLTPSGPRGRRIGPVSPDTSFDAFVAALQAWVGAAARPAVPEAPTLRPRVRTRKPRPVSPVVTSADAVLVSGLLIAWFLMIVVLTLL
ncbi:MAG: hypothetical protein AAGA48_05810 [Myxococcota bacterium]